MPMGSEFGNQRRIRESRILRTAHKPPFEVATKRDDDYLIVQVTVTSRTPQRAMSPALRAEIMRDVGDQLADIAAGMLLEAEEIESDADALEQALDACEACARGAT